MAEAERAGPSPAITGLLNPVPALSAQLALAQGNAAAAACWTANKALSPDDDPGYAREREYLVPARVLLSQHQPRPALGLLARLMDTAQSQGRTGSLIEIRALRALVSAASGDHAAATQELAAALTLASPQGHIQVFADEGLPMAALLGQVAAVHQDGQAFARQTPLSYLAAVLRACEPSSPEPAPGRDAAFTVPGLIEPLTSREMQVLELLAAGSPNQHIANDLVVTIETVKKHVTHLLGKLGAANRTEAVTRARQLGLIP